MVTRAVSTTKPQPQPIPIDAENQIVAAVVKPRMERPFLTIVPAPIKPKPARIEAAIREAS